MRLVQDRLGADSSLSVSCVIGDTAVKLGISKESLRMWWIRERFDSGYRPGIASEENAEIRRLRRDHAELRRTNEILQLASAFFASKLDPQRRK